MLAETGRGIEGGLPDRPEDTICPEGVRGASAIVCGGNDVKDAPVNGDAKAWPGGAAESRRALGCVAPLICVSGALPDVLEPSGCGGA